MYKNNINRVSIKTIIERKQVYTQLKFRSFTRNNKKKLKNYGTMEIFQMTAHMKEHSLNCQVGLLLGNTRKN